MLYSRSLLVIYFIYNSVYMGEGNGTPLQYSCLENPRDRGAWWAAVYGVAQSWTRLKRLSSSSSRINIYGWILKLVNPTSGSSLVKPLGAFSRKDKQCLIKNFVSLIKKKKLNMSKAINKICLIIEKSKSYKIHRYKIWLHTFSAYASHFRVKW